MIVMIKQGVKMKFNNTGKVLLALLIALAVIYAINIAVTGSMVASLSEKIAEQEEETRPAELQLVRITADCEECPGIGYVAAALQQSSLVEITKDESIDYRSSRAQELISRIGIREVPALVVFGEIAKPSVQDIWDSSWRTEIIDGKGEWAVFDAAFPPYIDTATGELKGLVSLTIIDDSSCNGCTGIDDVVTFLKQNGVVFSDEKRVDYRTENAQELIEQHSIERVPALVISENVIEYPSIAQVWEQVGATERDGFFALHSLQLPYRDLASGDVKGLVSVIYINDSSCSECYDVYVNKRILGQNFGVFLSEERFVDAGSSEGQEIIDKYGMSAVPAIVVSKDAFDYTGFADAWEQVGTQEDDGWFVMRTPGVLGVYRNLETGEVVGAGTGTDDSVREINVKGTEFRYTPSAIEVSQGEKVRIIFENAGDTLHDLAIDGLDIKTELIAPGNTDVLEFTAGESGTFAFYCTVPGHREAGMEGTLVVS